MANLEINLLPKKGSREILANRWYTRIKKGSVWLLGAYMALLLGVFGTKLLVSQIEKTADEKVVAATDRVNTYVTTESNHALVKSKLNFVSKTLVTQESWYDFILKVVVKLPTGVKTNQLRLEKDGGLRLGVESGSLRQLVSLINLLPELVENYDFIDGVSLEKTEKNNKGSYGLLIFFKT